ncbi:phenazine biosynthesis protein [Vibrio sp. vnigr-6D03]|uniref:pyridoxal 5'-phosphate synthase n=1 Tax=Vibrio sp. vnigr-6D03 TaxID=2058088 RepID=UPI000C3426A7|nr:pyridoxal 5'-phosphate synthase [Vibrio sp. vnigr-6D03]PKF80050.1 phenazine biosynthesis protein [Vibrio sp. vnigr-6D03]
MSSKLESMSGIADTPFPKFLDTSVDPINLAQSWLKYAKEIKAREPSSMVLTTQNGEGQLTSRVMAALGFSIDGITFATHSCSRKIQDAEAGSKAVCHFYWKELGRQLSVCGEVKELNRDEIEKYWNARPAGLHPMSTISKQSEPLIKPSEMLKQAEELEQQGVLPCPEHFSVYLLIPTEIEFWASSSDRLHRRIRCEKDNGHWNVIWLQP